MLMVKDLVNDLEKGNRAEEHLKNKIHPPKIFPPITDVDTDPRLREAYSQRTATEQQIYQNQVQQFHYAGMSLEQQAWLLARQLRVNI